jgi:hypothetical protein
MNVSDKVRIEPSAWSRFVREGGPRPGQKFNPGVQIIDKVHEDGEHYSLSYPPNFWWTAEDLTPVPEPMVSTETPESAAITRAFCAVMEMWGRRLDYHANNLSPQDIGKLPSQEEGASGVVVVDHASLAVAHSELLSVIRVVNPAL